MERWILFNMFILCRPTVIPFISYYYCLSLVGPGLRPEKLAWETGTSEILIHWSGGPLEVRERETGENEKKRVRDGELERFRVKRPLSLSFRTWSQKSIPIVRK